MENSPSTGLLLATEKLAKEYRGRRVVNGVSVNVGAGEIVGLLGPNGAGKTTTFNMVVGVEKPDEGRVSFQTHEITTLPMHERARLGIGYLTQEPSVFRKLTVEENILAILETLKLSRAERAVRLYGSDREAPVRYEPSSHDFLSPLLGEADLLRRAMGTGAFSHWLTSFLPAADSPDLARWLTPVVSPDQSDGKLSHLDGLNLSRAWMLDGIVSALPAANPLREPLLAAAHSHREAGLAGAKTAHYAGTHWLGSFAMYLLTSRGLG